jgi:tetratricopeptide (TPR) repeat protein
MKQQTTTDRRTQVDERAPIRERWTAQPPGASDEAVAGAMLRSAALVRPFGATELDKVGARLRGKERFRPRPLALQLAIAASLVLLGGVLSAAVTHVLRAPSQDKRDLPVAPPASKPVRRALLGSSRPASVISPALSAAEPLPEPAPPATRPVVMRPNRAMAIRQEQAAVAPPSSVEPPLAPPPAAGPSSLAQESRILARAIAELRQEGDAEQALAILDQHRAEFGASDVLTPEANATRIEALLQLGRHVQALALLDAQFLSATGVGREMLVARAELRADRGRRASALHDFDLLLRAEAPADFVTERALYGRAVCRGKAGNWEEARKDFERYLATFPDGKFADKARAAMNR